VAGERRDAADDVTMTRRTLRTALLFQDGNFVGREYFARLDEAGRRPDFVASVGRMPPQSVATELARTGGKWTPPEVPAAAVAGRFERLGDPALWAALREAAVDVAIQGGVGILKPDMIAVPRIGFLNVHPGRLPAYRGNSCPEWAVLNGEEVIATAHLIDDGIDTGPLICARPYPIDPVWRYEDFRARLYAHCAAVLIEALQRLEAAADPAVAARPQDEASACYRPPMPPDLVAAVKAKFPLRA
jgi:methionyl-tRNA formyltransferase